MRVAREGVLFSKRGRPPRLKREREKRKEGVHFAEKHHRPSMFTHILSLSFSLSLSLEILFLYEEFIYLIVLLYINI